MTEQQLDYDLARANGLLRAQMTKEATPFWVERTETRTLTHWLMPDGTVIVTSMPKS